MGRPKETKTHGDGERYTTAAQCTCYVPAAAREELLTLALVEYDEKYASLNVYSGGRTAFSGVRVNEQREKRMRAYLRGKKVKLEIQEFYALRYAVGQYLAKQHPGHVPPREITTVTFALRRSLGRKSGQ